MKLNPVKIRITNFQSIEQLEIDVHGFCVITGPSNIGKSAIIRAASSAILNNPVVNMVRKGTAFTTVELQSEEWAFKWEKNDKGVNRVFIPPSAEKALDKIGQTQVPEIVDMGFGSIEIGDDEIQPWFAPQFEPLFLLNQSGPRVTDFLSEVSRLTTLQDAITLAARGKRASTDKAKAKSEETSKLRNKLLRVNELDNLESLGTDLEEQAKSIEEYETRINLGQSFLSKREETEKVIFILEPIERLKIPNDAYRGSISKLQDLYSFCFQLESVAVKIRSIYPITKLNIPTPPTEEINKLHSIQKFAQIESLRRLVKLLDNISKVRVSDSKKLKDEVSKLQHVSIIADQIHTLQNSVSLLDQEIHVPVSPKIDSFQKIVEFAQQTKHVMNEISDLEKQLLQLNNELSDVNEEIASIPSCPACNRPFNPQHTSH